jgi:ABC-type nitrate/sulfonate/bicarbonate transport system ATPase subunit
VSESDTSRIINIWQGSGKTMLHITHDIDEAIYLSDRVFIMSARPGQIIDEIKVGIDCPRKHHALLNTATNYEST